jgi:hypothetical protein
VKKQHILGFNIVGVKGTDGSRKRPRGAAGGWRTGWHGCVPTRTSVTPCRRARRRHTGESRVYNDNVNIQVDEPSNNQVTEVVMLVEEVDTIQENMEVDIVTSAVVGPRWNKWRQKTPTSISDKSKSEGDYWANKMLVSGVGEEDVPPQQHHLQGGDVAGQHHQLPGHVDRSKLVHMKEIPGKLKLIPNLIVTLPGSSAQAENGGAGDVRGVQVGQGGGHHGHEDEAGQGEQSDQHGHQSDGGPVAEQHRRDGWADGQREQHGEGQHDRDHRQQQVQGYVWDDGGGGGVVEEKKSVLARIGSGYGITPQKRSYWRRKSRVPDGLVQRRINQFSVSVGEKLGGGNFEENLRGGRKRKWEEPTTNSSDVTK